MSRYPFEWSDSEIVRLSLQGVLLKHVSRCFLWGAGIAPGMSVLDVGCGVGDSTLILAEMVGHSGEVVAIDTSVDAVEVCAKRCVAAGFTNTTAVVADLHGIPGGVKVDAAYARLVLSYVEDPTRAIVAIGRHVRRDGLVCLQEFDHRRAPLVPPGCTEWASLHEEVLRCLAAAGVPLDSSARLPEAVRAAGCRIETMSLNAVCTDEPDVMVQYMRSLVDEMMRANVAGLAASILPRDNIYWGELAASSGLWSLSPLMSIVARRL